MQIGDDELSMEFNLTQFEQWVAWFNAFCRRMEKSNLPAMPRAEHDGLLSVNLQMQKALLELKERGAE
jgi:septation ring formation regulator EzrA